MEGEVVEGCRGKCRYPPDHLPPTPPSRDGVHAVDSMGSKNVDVVEGVPT